MGGHAETVGLEWIPRDERLPAVVEDEHTSGLDRFAVVAAQRGDVPGPSSLVRFGRDAEQSSAAEAADLGDAAEVQDRLLMGSAAAALVLLRRRRRRRCQGDAGHDVTQTRRDAGSWKVTSKLSINQSFIRNHFICLA